MTGTGIHFAMAPEVYAALTGGLSADDAQRLAWQVRRRFLEQRLAAAPQRFEFAGGAPAAILATRPDSFAAQEIRWLAENAPARGYVLEGDAWVRREDPA